MISFQLTCAILFSLPCQFWRRFGSYRFCNKSIKSYHVNRQTHTVACFSTIEFLHIIYLTYHIFCVWVCLFHAYQQFHHHGKRYLFIYLFIYWIISFTQSIYLISNSVCTIFSHSIQSIRCKWVIHSIQFTITIWFVF